MIESKQEQAVWRMKQRTISDLEYDCRKRKTKREEFLEIMEIILREDWVDVIAPHYPEGKRGRPPKGIEKMLRMYLLQCWFSLPRNLGDPLVLY